MEEEIHISSSSSEPTSIEEVDEESSSKVNCDYNEEESLSAVNSCGVDFIHSKMCLDWIPVVSMQFETEESAHYFYNRYAYEFGFGTRLSKSHSFANGFLKDRLFVCSAEGKSEKNKKSVYVKVSRAETRFDCRARMKIKYDLVCQKYVVSEFVASHNHLNSTPSKTHRFRSHRKMSLTQNVIADMAEDSGINPKQSLELLSRQAGGRKNLGFIAEDYRNYLRSKRTREVQLGDTGGVLEYLQQMQAKDPSFSYAIQVDVDDLITNIFWVDAKMKVDYDYFGDVVCFDTTYRKNKDGRPFAMFVGVNNHKQTIIFGVALLYDETAETFMWLFDTFVSAMSGKKPKSIFTDQDPTMAKALAAKWSETHHRLCIWHIYQNAAKHLKCVFEKFKDFAKELSSIIYDYEDVEDFTVAWQKMLEKYKVEDNTWLRQLYDVKEKWALVYGRATFSADITTTQRSESMNSSIKKYVSYKNDLLRFFRNFQRLVDDRRYNELDADFKALHTSPALSFSVNILRDAAKVYTPAVFKWFQEELSKGYDCTFKLFAEIEHVKKYEVNDHGKFFHHVVTFDLADNIISCSCKKFEFAGILCSHALMVLSANDVKTIPCQYILKRWRKDVRYQATTVPSPNAYDNDDLKGKIIKRSRDLARLHTELVTIAVESDEAYEIALKGLQKTLDDIKSSLKTRQKPPEDTSIINNSTHEVFTDEFGEHIVKGTKIKEKIDRKDDSIRPKNALEKLIGSKRYKKVAKSSPRHQMEPQMATQNELQMPNFLPFHQQFNYVPFSPRTPFTSPMHSIPQFISPYHHAQGVNPFCAATTQAYSTSAIFATSNQSTPILLNSSTSAPSFRLIVTTTPTSGSSLFSSSTSGAFGLTSSTSAVVSSTPSPTLSYSFPSPNSGSAFSSSSPSTGFVFGAPSDLGGNQFPYAGALRVNLLQFASQQTQQNRAFGSLEFNVGGSISLGTGDKSNRRIAKVRKQPKK